jgi:hypothetical protein
VGADVQVGRDLGKARHAGLGDHPGDVAGGEGEHALARLLLFLELQVGEVGAVEEEAAARRGQKDVAPALAGHRLGHEVQVPEVAGQGVLGRHIGDGILNLEHVARSQPLEDHHLGPQVVIKAVPGLGQVAIVATGGLQLYQLTVAPRPVDLSLADLHLLTAGGVAHVELQLVARRLLRLHMDQPLGEALRQAVGVHPHHLLVDEHGGARVVLAGRGG